jgi:hypothetical protein
LTSVGGPITFAWYHEYNFWSYNMRTKAILTLGLLILLGTAPTFGHGIPLNISIDSSNQLYSQSLVTFDHLESELILTGTGVKGAAGFYPKYGVFPAGQALTVNASGSSSHAEALIYWDDSTETLGLSPVSILLSRTGLSMTVNPTDTAVTGGTLPAYNGTLTGHAALNITLPTSAPTGLYAIGFKVSNPNFLESETFWAVGNYGVTDEDAVARGLAAIHTQVPEPSSVVLAGMAVVGGIALIGKRRQRRSL